MAISSKRSRSCRYSDRRIHSCRVDSRAIELLKGCNQSIDADGATAEAVRTVHEFVQSLRDRSSSGELTPRYGFGQDHWSSPTICRMILTIFEPADGCEPLFDGSA